MAEKIAGSLSLELSPIEIHVFPDGERRVRIETSVLDEDTIIVQPTAVPVDQNYMELFFIADALKRSGAKSITAVIPYLGYQRQDHVFRDGEAVSLEVIVNALESVKIDRVIAFDFHTVKTPEIFSIPVSHLSALPIFAQRIKDLITSLLVDENFFPGVTRLDGLKHSSSKNFIHSREAGVTLRPNNYLLVSPDMGGLRRIKIISGLLDNMSWIATVKDRDLTTGKIAIDKFDFFESGLKEEDLNGRTAFIVDDMASSGGTLIESAKLLKKNGVRKIYAFVTHPIFSVDGPKLLQESEIEKIFVTDSVYVPEEKKFPKLEIISVAERIAKELKQFEI